MMNSRRGEDEKAILEIGLERGGEEAGKEDEEKREERWISRGCWIAHTCERQRDG